MYDFADKVFAAGILLVLVMFSAGLVYYIFDNVFLEPERAENALVECNQKGWDSYSDYTKKVFSTKPYGLKCNNINNEFNINGQGVLAVSPGD